MPAAQMSLSPRVMGRLRLASQGLLGGGFPTVPDAVRWMTAMQAQDLGSALWAVGQRVPGTAASDVRAALDAGTVVRSWPMRGTLHLLAPEDLRWILGITSERLMNLVAGRHRELAITPDDINHCRDIAFKTTEVLKESEGAPGATREQLFQAFEEAGQITKAQRGIHLLGSLCQRALLVQGPMAVTDGKVGVQQLFVPFDEWIPDSRNLGREEGIAELLFRYLRSHGPATIKDFSWWSQVPLTEARTALKGIQDRLVELQFGGASYWLSPETAAMLDDGVPGSRSLLALPGFDEYLLGYQDRSLVLAPGHAELVVPGKNGVFKRIMVSGGEVVGTWARTANGKTAGVAAEPFTGQLGPAAERSFQAQGRAYLKFMAG
ncbi:winged helix DNA-binding domain-containing protein [Paenarthrobacter aurescens]|uniref:winged helix DNA-binding domain-containing protein n=1 Tax=Paenarthrobacter aurescens TaxID=43663 RepID=UPI0021C15FFF|nr:winged helix DNA-binding domain-containing protein [Paenarthrobacter aurescens]MCT9869322.1 winged helix DNA-binding domain-containing protein [Paenarthrobacter aurescens]